MPQARSTSDRSTPQSGAESGRFVDLAKAAGLDFRMQFLPNEQGENFKINLYDHGCGIAVADYNNDGREDIYFVNQLGPNGLFRNKGDGTFADVTQTAGVGHIGHSATAAFIDFDNDGLLDLLVTNTAEWTTAHFNPETKSYDGIADFAELIAARKEHNLVYRNNGNGTFSDITSSSGLVGEGWGGDIAAFDYNEDGRLDILITNMFGASQLYRNDGDCKFAAVTKEVLGQVSWGAIGAKCLDYDNNGKLDLFISDMHSDMWVPWTIQEAEQFILKHADAKYRYVTGATYMMDKSTFAAKEQQIADLAAIKYDDVIFGNTMYKNLGESRMSEVSAEAKMETWWPWGVATGDFDCDGYEDVFLPSGMGFPYFYWPNHLMMNNGQGAFVESALKLGIEPPVNGEMQAQKIGGRSAPRSSRCAAVADFDADGRLEIVTNNFNDAPYFFHNELPRKNYVAFQLTGTRSNRDAIGAVIRLKIGQETMTRQVNSACGYLSQSSKTLHFGLGDREKIEQAEIRWPSGRLEVVKLPAINQIHKITEPQG